MGPSPFLGVLASIAQRLSDRNIGVTATIRFDLGESGCYRLVLERGNCRAEAGDGEADATIEASEQDAIALMTGKLSPTYAMYSGKAKASGDLQRLMILQTVLQGDETMDDQTPKPLSSKYPPQALKDILLPRANWRPYPTIEQPEAWGALPESLRQAIVAQGEDALTSEWPVLLAVRYLDYARDGNRSKFSRVRSQRRQMLLSMVVAECVEGQGRFLDEIANGIWLICEESSWCVPAHIGVQKAGIDLPDTTEPIVDLFAAETSALLAWTDYLLGDKLDVVSTLIRPRVQREIASRILTPCLERDDFWWMGFTPRRVNNWNPWINSNWLTSALLMEEDEDRRLAAVAKSMRSIDRFVGPYPRDGGCDEGPGYWGRAGASLLDCLELLYSATDGQVDLYGDPLIQDIGRFIYRVQIEGAYFVNFADASAIVMPPPAVVFRYGQRIGDRDMMALGSWIADQLDLRQERSPDIQRGKRMSLGRLLPTLFMLDEIYAVQPRMPLPRDVWLDAIEVAIARDQAGSSAGFYVAAKGGHNAESHNHNDVGNFVVYVDGKPVIVDAGVETYTRKTFSAQRYEIWTMQSAYHSLLPTVDGVMQAPGREFAARDVGHKADDASAEFSVDIAAAYPPEAKIKSWQRKVTLHRGQDVEIEDNYDLAEPAQEISLSLLTPCQIKLKTPGEIPLQEASLPDGRTTGTALITYDPDKLTALTIEIAISDERLGLVWGNRLTRIVLVAHDPPQQGTLHLQITAQA
jgi:putative sterol carrier protein